MVPIEMQCVDLGRGVQCKNLVQTYEPLIQQELHWWEKKGITKDLLDRSTDAKVPPGTPTFNREFLSCC